MLALIDADVLRYECASVGQKFNKETNDWDIGGFDFVRSVFDDRVRSIQEGCGAEDVRLFITASTDSIRMENKLRRREGLPDQEFIPNFRDAIAEGKPYKGTRKQDKPFHWINLTAYILSLGDVSISNGCEADDLIGIAGYGNTTTVICTRDKDLRQVPGLHYGWECGKQPEFGPVTYDRIGTIELVRGAGTNKIVGGGFAFFCAQLLTGDVVDNVGGAKGIGPVKAYNYLKDCTSERGYFDAVVSCYKELDDTHWKERLQEQCSLLWIIRERNEDGTLKHFNIEEWL